jgi:hypothetical protein
MNFIAHGPSSLAEPASNDGDDEDVHHNVRYSVQATCARCP